MPLYLPQPVTLGLGGTGAITAAAARTALAAAASGANTDITSLAGSATNDSAAAGKIGEYLSGSLVQGSAVSISNNSAKTVISVSLTAGDWDVQGGVIFEPAATTNLACLIASLSLTDNVQGSANSDVFTAWANAGTVPNQHITVVSGAARFSLASTTTVYLVGYALFTVSTLTAWGKIWARRVR